MEQLNINVYKYLFVNGKLIQFFEWWLYLDRNQIIYFSGDIKDYINMLLCLEVYYIIVIVFCIKLGYVFCYVRIRFIDNQELIGYCLWKYKKDFQVNCINIL